MEMFYFEIKAKNFKRFFNIILVVEYNGLKSFESY